MTPEQQLNYLQNLVGGTFIRSKRNVPCLKFGGWQISACWFAKSGVMRVFVTDEPFVSKQKRYDFKTVEAAAKFIQKNEHYKAWLRSHAHHAI